MSFSALIFQVPALFYEKKIAFSDKQSSECMSLMNWVEGGSLRLKGSEKFS